MFSLSVVRKHERYDAPPPLTWATMLANLTGAERSRLRGSRVVPGRVTNLYAVSPVGELTYIYIYMCVYIIHVYVRNQKNKYINIIYISHYIPLTGSLYANIYIYVIIYTQILSSKEDVSKSLLLGCFKGNTSTWCLHWWKMLNSRD